MFKVIEKGEMMLCSDFFNVLLQASGSSDIQKQDCVWLFVSHQKCKPDDLVSHDRHLLIFMEVLL